MIIVKNFFCHCRNIRPVERYRRSSASSLVKYFEIFLLELMATNFSPSSGSYVLNKFPSISQWSDTGPSWPSCHVCLTLLHMYVIFTSRYCKCAQYDPSCRRALKHYSFILSVPPTSVCPSTIFLLTL